MGFSKLTDREFLNWLDRQIELRTELSRHCIVDGCEVASDDSVTSRLLIYEHANFERLAKICNSKVNVERIKSQVTDLTLEFTFEYNGIIVVSYVKDEEVNNE